MAKTARKKLKKTSWLRKIGRFFLYLWLGTTTYAVVLRWVNPPVTLTQLSALFNGYGLQRDYVDYDAITAAVKLAAIASEDQLFPDHSGFDWASLEKSLQTKPGKKNKKRGAGASTISQQVAKNVFLWQGSGVLKYVRKIPEAYFTVVIELCWSKRRILDVYLNCIEMGPGIFGIEAAAQAYYKKPANKLTKQEAATIIACLPNPKKYTVVPKSRFVTWKTGHILRQMNNIAADADVQTLVKSR